ncbi:hypothetical protein M758_8G191900 [Ceratodon purpureus]|nr:hypothetical protein M758_8G191900 [Ceratodon purpureus]
MPLLAESYFLVLVLVCCCKPSVILLLRSRDLHFWFLCMCKTWGLVVQRVCRMTHFRSMCTYEPVKVLELAFEHSPFRVF